MKKAAIFVMAVSLARAIVEATPPGDYPVGAGRVLRIGAHDVTELGPVEPARRRAVE